MSKPDIGEHGGSILDFVQPSKRPAQTESPIIQHAQDTDLWLFDFHNTFVRGVIQSVALNFKSLDGDKEAVSYFNVILHGRGDNSYPTGRDGQFIPAKGSKYREFWIDTVGEEPYRWSLVHRYMKKAFEALAFTGESVTAIDAKGKPYLKLTNIRTK